VDFAVMIMLLSIFVIVVYVVWILLGGKYREW